MSCVALHASAYKGGARDHTSRACHSCVHAQHHPAEPPAQRLPPLHGTLSGPRTGADSGVVFALTCLLLTGGQSPWLTTSWALVNKRAPAPLPVHLLGFSSVEKGQLHRKAPRDSVTPVHKHHPEQHACTWTNTVARHCPSPSPAQGGALRGGRLSCVCLWTGRAQRSRLLPVGSCK